jgi:hypothetical protein
MEPTYLKSQLSAPQLISTHRRLLPPFSPCANTAANSYFALRYINFPMMLLAKSCKLVPVMFMGWAINGETYSKGELIAVSFISLGVNDEFVVRCVLSVSCVLSSSCGQSRLKGLHDITATRRRLIVTNTHTSAD